MRNTSSCLLVFLLSLALHFGAVLAFGPKIGISRTGTSAQEAASVIAVNLTRQASAQPAELVPTELANADAALIPSQEQLTEHDESGAESGDSRIASIGEFRHEAPGEASVLPVLMPNESHYFSSTELTEVPAVLQDISPDNALTLPDVSPPPARVSLLINEQGGVDQVVIHETTLSEQARLFISDVFTKVTFRPGKLGDLPVKSELDIEVRLEEITAVPLLKPVTIH